MNTVTLDGVEYTKAAQVAKQFGYTSDYIGQLCRAKKVNARLVGRSWFVNIPSLEAHREGKYKKSLAAEIPEEAHRKNLETEEVVGSEAVPVTINKPDKPSKKYLRRVSAPTARLRKVTDLPSRPGEQAGHVSVQYEPDDNSLIPTFNSSPKVTLLKVDIAESEPLAVKSGAKTGSILTPEALPDVALSGALTVSEIPDGEYSNEDTAAEKMPELPPEDAEEKKSDKRDNLKDKLHISKIAKKKKLAEEQKVSSAPDSAVPKKAQPAPNLKKPARVKLKMQRVGDFAPKKPDVDEIPVTNLNPTPQNVPIRVSMPAVGLVLGIVAAAFVLSAEQVVTVSSEAVDFAIKFDWSNVSNIALVLFTG